MNKDDAELIAKLLAGDRQAWTRFESGDYAKLIYWAMRKPCQSKSGLKELKVHDVDLSQEDAEDLHRDILCKIIEKLKTFEGRNGCSLKSWVRTIAVSKAIDHLRKKKLSTVSIEVSREDEDGNRYSDPSVDDAMADIFHREQEVQLHKEELKVLLDFLDNDDRQFAEECFDPDKKPEDVATSLGITVKNYYVRKMRLRQKLDEIAQKNKIR